MKMYVLTCDSDARWDEVEDDGGEWRTVSVACSAAPSHGWRT